MAIYDRPLLLNIKIRSFPFIFVSASENQLRQLHSIDPLHTGDSSCDIHRANRTGVIDYQCTENFLISRNLKTCFLVHRACRCLLCSTPLIISSRGRSIFNNLNHLPNYPSGTSNNCSTCIGSS